MKTKRQFNLIARILLSAGFIFTLCGAANTVEKKQTANQQTNHTDITFNTNIQQGLDQIINSLGKNVNVGVMIADPATGKVLYQHNGYRLFTPASTLKLFSSSAALALLGPDYVFKTRIMSNATPQNGVLNGNLYIKFGADPQLSVGNLSNMVAALRKNGVTTIQGNVVIDDSIFDHSNWGAGWMWDEQILCYASPTGGIILNRNCFGFSVAPGKGKETPAIVKMNIPTANISIVNNVTSRPANASRCGLDLRVIGSNTYRLTGCVSANQAPVSLGISLNDPSRAGKNIIEGLLKQQNITVTGTITEGTTSPDAKVLVEHDSAPLSKLVTRMLKKSDNLIADTLLKLVGHAYFKTSGTWANGARAERAILKPAGINFTNVVIMDGSGLSRYDLISPNDFVKLLNYDYRKMPASALFYQALPISSVDGTLRYRLGGSAQGKIHAKTGTMHSASGLAGYVTTANHQVLTFAILVNGFIGKHVVPHMIQDNILQYLTQKNV